MQDLNIEEVGSTQDIFDHVPFLIPLLFVLFELRFRFNVFQLQMVEFPASSISLLSEVLGKFYEGKSAWVFI